MLHERNFRWLPNALTLIRMSFAIPICLAAVNGTWALGFWLLLVALATDFLDGLAAKKLHAQTKVGAVLDVVADGLLAAAGIAGLVAVGIFPLWAATVLFVWTCFVGYERWFWRSPSVIRVIRPKLSVSVLFATWVYVTWAYIGQAYGWHWWYVPITLLALAVSASLKRHRLRAWLALHR